MLRSMIYWSIFWMLSYASLRVAASPRIQTGAPRRGHRNDLAQEVCRGKSHGFISVISLHDLYIYTCAITFVMWYIMSIHMCISLYIYIYIYTYLSHSVPMLTIRSDLYMNLHMCIPGYVYKCIYNDVNVLCNVM